MNQAPREFIRGLHNLRPRHRGCVASIGSFDGVHLGHQAVLKQLTQAAQAHQLPAVVIIFEPQPHEFFAGDAAPARLMRLREKVEALFAAGVQRVLCLRFNRALRSLTAREFVQQLLLDRLGIKHLVVGDDFRFGCDRLGDFALLRQMGQEQGFTVSDSCTLTFDGARVSSTRIRQALQNGEFALASKLLGHPYTISGRVVYGQQLGRQLNVPTANVQLQRYRSPLQGVFAISAHLPDGNTSPGVANIGVRPTVSGSVKALLEVHLLDFSASLYGAKIRVEFHRRLRDEKKFQSLEELRAQLQRDIEQARDYFKNHHTGQTITRDDRLS